MERKTVLTTDDIRRFWFRVYLGTSNTDELIMASINRAYRDFNRTLHGVDQSISERDTLRDFVLNIVKEPLTITFDQDSYDNWHKQKCDCIKEIYHEIIKYHICYGQAQKWINMSLKYMFAIGNDIIDGIDRNYEFFHVPLDNIIQDKLTAYNIKRIPTSWSRIDDYNIYLDYQKKVRSTFDGQIPLDVEFRLFNE